jgi:MYXO-CTERM domain-containing protein
MERRLHLYDTLQTHKMLLTRRGHHDGDAGNRDDRCGLCLRRGGFGDPAGAATIEFTLGSEPKVAASFFQLGVHPPFFVVTARLDASTALWVQDTAIGRVFSTAEVTETFAESGRIFEFSEVSAASVYEDTFGDAPTITAAFDYRTFSVRASGAPEPSIWAMLLIGAGGLAVGRHCVSRRRRSCPA